MTDIRQIDDPRSTVEAIDDLTAAVRDLVAAHTRAPAILFVPTDLDAKQMHEMVVQVRAAWRSGMDDEPTQRQKYDSEGGAR